MRLVTPLLAAAPPAAALAPRPATAHEFRIEPEAYQVAPGEAIAADLRVGERFPGRALSDMPGGTERFEIVQGGTATPVEGRTGDRPAQSQAEAGEGPAVVVHETDDRPVTYDDGGVSPSARAFPRPWTRPPPGASARR